MLKSSKVNNTEELNDISECDLWVETQEMEDSGIDILESPEALNKRMKECEYKSKELDNDDKEGDISLKKSYFVLVGSIISIWLIILALLVALSGANNGFHLSDAVIITMLTTTTINVLFLFHFVGRYLFNANK